MDDSLTVEAFECCIKNGWNGFTVSPSKTKEVEHYSTGTVTSLIMDVARYYVCRFLLVVRTVRVGHNNGVRVILSQNTHKKGDASPQKI